MNAIIPKKRRDGKSSFEDLIAYTSVRDDVPEDELRPDTEMKAEILSRLVENVWEKIEKGFIRPTIYKTLPITEAEAAHAILQRGENVGKVVLTVK